MTNIYNNFHNTGLKKTEIWQGNDITLGKFKYSKVQARIYYNILRQIAINFDENKRMQLQFDLGNYPVAVDIRQLIDPDQKHITHLNQLKEEIRGLQSKIIKLRKGATEVQIVGAVHYNKIPGKIIFEIHRDVKNELVDIWENYGNTTRYFFEAAIKMQGVYSDRLYQIFSKTKDLKNNFYLVDDLKEMLNANISSYKSFSRFRDLILEPSIDEINEHSDIYVSWGIGTKIGKRIHAISVTIEQNTPQMKEAGLNQHEKAYKQLVEKWQLATWQAQNIIMSCDIKDVNRELYNLQMNKLNGLIKRNIGGYSKTFFENKLNIDLTKKLDI